MTSKPWIEVLNKLVNYAQSVRHLFHI